MLLADSALAAEQPLTVDLEETAPWPAQFELDLGETAHLKHGEKVTTVKLNGVEHLTEPDYWTRSNPQRRTYCSADVSLEVDGVPTRLRCRPYEMPKLLGGVRLYVETTKAWAETPQFLRVQGVEKAVRFSAVPESRSWGPADLLFPLADYRWRSSTYENTWNSLVPFNVLYYHRGEDLGAIPDRLELRSALDGVIVASPVPNGDGRSNGVIVQHGPRARIRYSHMNLEHLSRDILPERLIDRGQFIGKTGSTYNGKRSQDADPHVHMELLLDGTEVSLFPTLVEAYFREYDDPVIALAGGYGFVLLGDSYTLDATRSLARPGRKIVSYRWKLHDGRELEGPVHSVLFSEPGFYAEELIVTADDGTEERDAIHIRVYETIEDRNISLGWVHYAPSREIRPGTEMTFWQRLSNVIPETGRIDFGDDSPMEPATREVRHMYKEPGVYTVAVSAKGKSGDAALYKVRVRVLPAASSP